MEKHFEKLLEDWLEDVFGINSGVVNEAFLEKVGTKGKWIFDSAQIRGRIFHEANIVV